MSPPKTMENGGIDGSTSTKIRKGYPKRLIVFLGVLVLILLVAVVILVVLLLTNNYNKWDDNLEKLNTILDSQSGMEEKLRNRKCDTPQCTEDAARMLRFMDTKADPCEDFYQYSCGNFEKIHLIPEGSLEIEPFKQLGVELKIKLKSSIERVEPDDIPAVQQLKTFYQSCMDEPTIETLSAAPMSNLIKQLFGTWALDPAWDPNTFNLEDDIIKIAAVESDVFLKIADDIHPKNSQSYILTVKQGPLGFSLKGWYLDGRNDFKLKNYEETVVNLAVAYGADRSFATAEIAKFIDFEIEQANITISGAEQKSPDNEEITTVGKMIVDYPGLDWMKLLSGILKDTGVTPTDDTPVHVSDINYMKQIGNLLSTTDKRTVAIAAHFNGIVNFTPLLDPTTIGILDSLSIALLGSASKSPRHETCLDLSNTLFAAVTTRMFALKYLDEGRADIKAMSTRIKDTFKARLEKIDWLDEDSLQKAKDKVDAIALQLAFPDFVLDDEKLEKFMEGVVMQAKTYFNNTVALKRHYKMFMLKRLASKVDRDQWFFPPVTVNAFYQPGLNSMWVPVGILLSPFYNTKSLKIMNFGALGSIIAHEISHGFDNSGRLYDKVGNKNEWMTPKAIEGFNKKAQCIIDQFSAIDVEELSDVKINGFLTQGENIADNAALPTAFNAYREWVAEYGDEKLLPGVDLDADKLFFLSFAQLWCRKVKPQYLGIKAETSVHTLNKYRVIGALRNSLEFQNAFKCAPGTKMNPDHKCQIW